MSGNVIIYIVIMASVTYTVRLLPFILLRSKITNRFVRSFLYYVPYVTLAVMIFPQVLYSTSSVISAVLGMATAFILAYCGKNLIQISLLTCSAVFIAEYFLH